MASRSASSALKANLSCTRTSVSRTWSESPLRHTVANVSTRRSMHISARRIPNLIAQQRPSLLSSIPRNIAPSKTSRRTIFIQTESTPNEDALKFNPNHRVLPESINSPFIEYLTPRSTLQPPHPSPLAAKLLDVEGVQSVFFGPDTITVTKASDAVWAHIKPEVFSLITEAVTSGESLVNVVANQPGSEGQEGGEKDTLAFDENDDEVVGMIKELLETRIRPAIQEDGGDIDFRGFEDGTVYLKLRGACRTCDSSTVTLKNGIESMLMHYIEEVQAVEQVLDVEEQISMHEFARFEEKLRAQKGKEAVASAPIDAAP